MELATPSDRTQTIILAEGEHLVFATRYSLSARNLVCPHTGGVANAPPPVTQIVTFGDVASLPKNKILIGGQLVYNSQNKKTVGLVFLARHVCRPLAAGLQGLEMAQAIADLISFLPAMPQV